jgi:hypothetical protein
VDNIKMGLGETRGSNGEFRAAPWLKRLVAGFPPLRSGVRDRVCHVGFCGGQSGAGVGYLSVLRFPLPIFIPPIAPKIIFIYHRGLYYRPKWPQYQGLRYLGTQSHPTNNKKTKKKRRIQVKRTEVNGVETRRKSEKQILI